MLTGYVFGSLSCLALAAILVAVVIGDGDLPRWLATLGWISAGILVVNAVRLMLRGMNRRRVLEGPRTRIVMTDVPEPPQRRR
jgi:hypothetical protein